MSLFIIIGRPPLGTRGRNAFDSVYTVGDEESLEDGARRLKPSVIVIDLSDITQKSLQLIRDIQNISPGSKVVALVTNLQELTMKSLVHAGASGIVFKTNSVVPGIDRTFF